MRRPDYRQPPTQPEPRGTMNITLLHGTWHTTQQLADLLGVDASTVRRWRTARPPQGPPFVQLSERVIMYNLHDVETWLQSRRIDPSEAA